MTILFITACLEPGKDGVGDYTRRLAEACTRVGHTCTLLALNDPFAADTNASTHDLPELRLPASLTWPERTRRAVDFISPLSHDWTSLQFVSYGFDPKGLIPGLANVLEPLTRGHRLHVMLHELWLGLDRSPSLRHRLVGLLQKVRITDMLRQLHPDLITTSNPYYQSVLQRAGFPARVQPIGGNIPIVSSASPPDCLVHHGITAADGGHPERWLGLIFGHLPPEWPAEPLLTQLRAEAKRTNRRLTLLSAGRQNTVTQDCFRRLTDKYRAEVDCLTLGELSSPEISTLLQTADFGLSTAPWHLVDKSGSTQAMLDHGLPVLVARRDVPSSLRQSWDTDPLLHRVDDELPAKLADGLKKRPPHDRVDDLARDFIAALS